MQKIEYTTVDWFHSNSYNMTKAEREELISIIEDVRRSDD